MTEGHLEFGFVERQLVADLRDIGRWKVRAEAMEQLHQRVVSLSSVGRLLPALPDFVAFLQTLLGDQNATIRLQTTHVVGDLVEKLGARLSLHVQPLAASMAENLGDSRDDLSEATVSVLLKVARASRPQKVIEALGPAVRQVDGHRRVEALRLVASALLVGEKTDFDYSSVIGLCVEAWRHADSAVKDAAVETLALVHAQVGPVTFKLMDGGYSAAEARNQLHEHVAKKKGVLPRRTAAGATAFSWEPDSRPAAASFGEAGAAGGEGGAGAGGEHSRTFTSKLRRNALRRLAEMSTSSDVSSTGTGGDPSDHESDASSSGSEEHGAGGGVRGGRRVGALQKTPPRGGALQRNGKGGRGGGGEAGGGSPGMGYRDLGTDGGAFRPRGGRARGPGGDDAESSRSLSSSPEKPIFLTEPDERRGDKGPFSSREGQRAEGSLPGGGTDAEEAGVELWLPCSARSPEKTDRRHKNHASSNPGGGNTAATPSAKPGSDRSGGVLTSLSALKRRQESRRANSASAVMQSPGDLYSRYSRDDMGVVPDYSVRGVTTDSTLRSVTSDSTGLTKLKLPSRMFGPTTSRGRDGEGGLDDAGDGDSPKHTFARGGISTPVSFRRSQGKVDPSPRRSARSLAFSSRLSERTGAASSPGGFSEMGKPLELAAEDLKPCASASQMVKDVMTTLAASNAAKRKDLDWMAQYNAINDARRLVQHHPQVVLAQLRGFLMVFLPSVEELRSYTVKNALTLLNEMLLNFRHGLDAELEHIMPVLIKKAGETSTAGRDTFLAQEADAVITSMLTNCSSARCVNALVAQKSHKSPHVRMKVIAHLQSTVELHGASSLSRDSVEKLVTAGVHFLDEGHVDARAYSKRMLWDLRRAGGQEIERLMGSIPHKRVRQILAAMECETPPPLPKKVHTSSGRLSSANGYARGPTSAPSHGSWGSSAMEAQNGGASGDRSFADQGGRRAKGELGRERRGGRNSYAQSAATKASRRAGSEENDSGLELESSSLGRAARKPQGCKPAYFKPDSSDAELEESISATLSKTMSRDWRQRCEGLLEAEGLVVRCSDSEKQVTNVFDHLIQRLSDGNAKVVVQTLDTMSRVLPVVKGNCGMVLNTLIPSLAQVLGSTNEKIRTRAGTAVDTLCREVDNTLLVQTFARCTSQGGARGKPAMMDKLGGIALDVYPRNPHLVTRHVLPAVVSVVNDKGSEIRQATHKMVCSLAYMMGTSFNDFARKLSTSNQARLNDILTMRPVY